MNIVQIFVALALFVISYVSAQTQLVIESPVSGSTLISGNNYNLQVTTGGPSTPISYDAIFTDSFGHTLSLNGLSTGIPSPVNLMGLIGNVILDVTTTVAGYSPAQATYTVVLPTLSIAAISDITYGQAVELTVTSDQVVPVITKSLLATQEITEYTASFSCTSGSYQITGLLLGTTYNLVPAGIYGQVVLTVTATNASPSTLAFLITKPDANIPPVYSPGRLPYYPSVYANMKDGEILEIVNVKYSETAPLMN